METIRDYPFRPRLRTQGLLEWSCPVCERLGRTGFTWQNWRIACETCLSVFSIGYKLWALPLGNVPPPPDLPIPESDLSLNGRIRVHGSADWLCPACGMVQDRQLNRNKWKLLCKARRCKRKYAMGYRIVLLAGGDQMIRPIDVSLPLCEFGTLQPGEPLNEFDVSILRAQTA